MLAVTIEVGLQYPDIALITSFQSHDLTAFNVAHHQRTVIFLHLEIDLQIVMLANRVFLNMKRSNCDQKVSDKTLSKQL